MVFPDIPYEQIDGVDPNLLNLDIYTPLNGGPNTPRSVGVYPVLVLIHGGSWKAGDKRDATVAAVKSPYFTSQGIIFVSINYRLAPLVKHPGQVEDVAAALAWIDQYIGYYGGDTGQIYLMGHSSGGQLAALVATDERYLAAHSLTLDIIHGVILLDAVGLDLPALITPSSLSFFETAFGSDPTVWKDASPLYHISPNKGIPPFLIFHAVENGEGFGNGQEMAKALTAYDANGRIRRIGFIPWNVFGYANSIFTWGWAFGGRFYDEKTFE
jgi:arylformamidase